MRFFKKCCCVAVLLCCCCCCCCFVGDVRAMLYLGTRRLPSRLYTQLCSVNLLQPRLRAQHSQRSIIVTPRGKTALFATTFTLLCYCLPKAELLGALRSKKHRGFAGSGASSFKRLADGKGITQSQPSSLPPGSTPTVSTLFSWPQSHHKLDIRQPILGPLKALLNASLQSVLG
ncbi:hypothetical protein J3F83DRAFT_373631 [Trichoderma novae-zelandiae]